MLLLKVLLAERGFKPEFKPLENYAAAKEKDFVLLIGDAALDFALAPHEHEMFDLGTAWFELTSLPFVFAVWALRRGIENQELRRQLREAKDFGMDTLDHIIREPHGIHGGFPQGLLRLASALSPRARTRSAALRSSWSCCASTASGRCLSQSS